MKHLILSIVILFCLGSIAQAEDFPWDRWLKQRTEEVQAQEELKQKDETAQIISDADNALVALKSEWERFGASLAVLPAIKRAKAASVRAAYRDDSGTWYAHYNNLIDLQRAVEQVTDAREK